MIFKTIKVCDCADISFGTVNEVMNWVGEPTMYHCIESCNLKKKKVLLYTVYDILTTI